MTGLVAGLTDKREVPLATAERKLKEETGYVWNLKYFGSLPSEKYFSRMFHCSVANNCKKVEERMRHRLYSFPVT